MMATLAFLGLILAMLCGAAVVWRREILIMPDRPEDVLLTAMIFGLAWGYLAHGFAGELGGIGDLFAALVGINRLWAYLRETWISPVSPSL